MTWCHVNYIEEFSTMHLDVVTNLQKNVFQNLCYIEEIETKDYMKWVYWKNKMIYCLKTIILHI